jgi:hypothetical protein
MTTPWEPDAEPSRRHYISLPPELVAAALVVLADGRARRAYRVAEALGLTAEDEWRVFPTLCALADAGELLRTQDLGGVDVFTGKAAVEPPAARQTIEAPPTPVSPPPPSAPPPAAPGLVDDTGPEVVHLIPDALADCRFLRLVSHGGIPQPPREPATPNWITGTRDDAERWLGAAGNVGLLLRELVVVDIDPKHALPRTATVDRDMAISMAADIARQLDLPPTLTERTRSGGLHFIYRAEPRRIYAEVPRPELQGESGPLVECRSGPHRWIILAPSRFTWPQAPMRWLRRAPLSAAPDWLPWKLWHSTPPPPPPGGIRPQTTDALSAHLDFRALLTGDGWTLLPHRDGYALAVRPGKHAQDGASATLDRVAPGVLHVFSTAAPLPPGNYNAWAYLVAAHFDGNALAALAAYEVTHGR